MAGAPTPTGNMAWPDRLIDTPAPGSRLDPVDPEDMYMLMQTRAAHFMPPLQSETDRGEGFTRFLANTLANVMVRWTSAMTRYISAYRKRSLDNYKEMNSGLFDDYRDLDANDYIENSDPRGSEPWVLGDDRTERLRNEVASGGRVYPSQSTNPPSAPAPAPGVLDRLSGIFGFGSPTETPDTPMDDEEEQKQEPEEEPEEEPEQDPSGQGGGDTPPTTAPTVDPNLEEGEGDQGLFARIAGLFSAQQASTAAASLASDPFKDDYSERRLRDASVRANLRPFLAIAGDDAMDEQDDDDAQRLKSQNLLMGMVKPVNWPLGNTDNPFWVSNIANTGMRYAGPLFDMPEVLSGGTLTDGATLYGSYRPRPTNPMDILPPPRQQGRRGMYR